MNIKPILKSKNKYDISDMYSAIKAFPNHISESLQYMETWTPKKSYNNIQNILVLGMGGSAIGGDVVSILTQSDCNIPIIVNRSYSIPAWVDENTLVLASSYSGNTEETLSAFNQSLGNKAQIIVLSTGGEITNLAKKHELDIVELPSGLQPRAALGHSFTRCLTTLQILGFISTFSQKLSNCVQPLELLANELSEMDDENPAIHLAQSIYDTIPVIYGSEELTKVVALRFRGQLQENAKMMAFHNHIPEMNHNEIEGWSENPSLLKQLSIIWLKDSGDHSRNKKRMNVTSSLLEDKADNQYSISMDGESTIERFLKLIHFTDWVSYYSALNHNIDPTPVNRIMKLKDEMGKN